MNKAFDLILERLEDFKDWEDDSGRPIHTFSEVQRISKCKEIVQEVAKEYKKNDYANEIQEMALELAVYVLEEEFLKYAWLENANNETGVVVTYKDAICIIKDMLKGSETDEEDI